MNNLIELEQATVDNWLANPFNTLEAISYGDENTYYEDEFGNQFFCKNYPEYDPTPWCHACFRGEQHCVCAYANNTGA